MNAKSVVGVSLVFGLSAIGAESQSNAQKRGGLNTRESIVAQLLPNEYREFSDRKELDPKKSADAALKLLRATRTKLRAERTRQDYDYNYVNAHATAWRICLQMRGAAPDEAVRKTFLDEWNSGLRDDNNEVPIQFAATIFPGAWSPDLFTDDFWELAQRTSSERTLSAICWLLYTHWRPVDLPILQKKMESAKRPLAGYINAAIGQISYKADRKGPGPATEPPTLKID